MDTAANWLYGPLAGHKTLEKKPIRASKMVTESGFILNSGGKTAMAEQFVCKASEFKNGERQI
ncbi:MAG: hypothetical protein KDJ29_02625, partial [Hyphomicrobiales bacterium]|nr:hypothetical protein [Hyphomicrobiales bacterium]